MLLQNEGSYLCRIIDHGISLTKNKYPQWVARLEAVEVYNAENEVWVDISDLEENEITTYQTLIGSKGETLSVQNIMNATGWDGVSLVELGELDLSEVLIQARVEYDTYNGKTSLKVTWLDSKDAVPGMGVVKKLTGDDLKKVDAEFRRYSSHKAKVTPTKAPPKAPPKSPSKMEKAEKIAAAQEVAGIPAPPTPPAPPADGLPVGKCTKREAWEAVYDLRTSDITDEQLAKLWATAINEVTGKTDQKKVTETEWFAIREALLDKIGKF